MFSFNLQAVATCSLININIISDCLNLESMMLEKYFS